MNTSESTNTNIESRPFRINPFAYYEAILGLIPEYSLTVPVSQLAWSLVFALIIAADIEDFARGLCMGFYYWVYSCSEWT